MNDATEDEQPLDHSAHLLAAAALDAALTTSGSLAKRVAAAHKILFPIIHTPFMFAGQGGPRTIELVQRLRLSEADRAVNLDMLGINFSLVPPNRLKRWLRDLAELYAWSCFMTGRNPELYF